MSGAERRAAIIATARQVFVDKGFHRTTTRELADAAGVSEALLFKHFASKQALYRAIQMSCFSREGARIAAQIELLEPSTLSLVLIVRGLVSHILGGKAGEDERSFLHLVFRSLMDDGDFARLAIQGGPCHWVRKVEECIRASKAVGDMVEGALPTALGAWCAHQLIAGMGIHFLPADPAVDYGVSREELMRQVTWFCLRGMGLKEEAIRRCCEVEAIPCET
jgi:AcrR family transcriptional regulator